MSIVTDTALESNKNFRVIFDAIEFAIYCREWETDNYNAFKAWCK